MLHGRSFQPVHEIPQWLMLRVEAFTEKTGCQHRGQRERYKQGKQSGKYDSQAKLPEELSGHAVHESNRHENCRITEGDGYGCHADLRTAIFSRQHRFFPHLQMPHDIFQYHDRVIHQDAHTQGHTHQ